MIRRLNLHRALRLSPLVLIGTLGGMTSFGLAAPSAAGRAVELRTVWDGVYTGEQAKRGEQLYKDSCGYCHRDNLSGGGSEAGAPALRGPLFTTRWKDTPLKDIFIAIGTTMPYDKPDTLTPEKVADILSFLLEANGFPPGPLEMPATIADLDQIVFTAQP